MGHGVVRPGPARQDAGGAAGGADDAGARVTMRDWSDLPIGELLIAFLLVVVIVTFVVAFAVR